MREWCHKKATGLLTRGRERREEERGHKKHTEGLVKRHEREIEERRGEDEGEGEWCHKKATRKVFLTRGRERRGEVMVRVSNAT